MEVYLTERRECIGVLYETNLKANHNIIFFLFCKGRN